MVYQCIWQKNKLIILVPVHVLVLVLFVFVFLLDSWEIEYLIFTTR